MSVIAKRNILLFLAFLAIATLLVAAALPQLELQPGKPLPAPNEETAVQSYEVQPSGGLIPALTFIQALVAILFILFPPILLYGLIKKSPWRQMIRSLTFAALITVVVISVLILLANRYGTPTELIPDQVTPTVQGPTVTTPIGSPPDWLIWIVFSVLAVIIGGVGLWVIYKTTHQPAEEQNRVAEEAEKAIDALKAGLDLKNVILRCYLQMSLALQEEQGIEREEAMTTREFERLLETRGIPHEPVHDLTRLFEAVRYGRRQANARDEQIAFDSLNAIIQYSRAGKQPG